MGFATNFRRSGDIKYRKSIQNPIISFLLNLFPSKFIPFPHGSSYPKKDEVPGD
jgi:hypothetical protein